MKFHKEKERNLFDFGDIEMESGVDPSKNLRSSDEISRIHHSDRHCFFFFFSFLANWQRLLVSEKEKFQGFLKQEKSGIFPNSKK